MSMKQDVLDVLSGKTVEKTPVLSATTCGIVDTMDYAKTNYPDAHKDSNEMARLGSALHDLTGLECVRVPFCLTVEAEAMGCEIDFGNNDKSAGVASTPYRSSEDITVPDDIAELGRIPTVLKALQLLKDEYPEVPVIAGAVGPFTLAGHLIGVENILRKILTDYLDVEATIDIAIEVLEQYLTAINEVNPDIICFADPNSSPELLSPFDYKFISKPALQEISEVVKPKSILHICGRTKPIIPDMLESGFDGISIEEKCPMDEAQAIKREMNSNVAIVGNISTSKTLFYSPIEDVKKECTEALQAGTDILAPSCGIAMRSPTKNIQAMVDARNEFYE
ncbi:MAG: methylcobamide:CoM methyltransferase MtaA [Methanobacteriaceae archaeon]|nr:methylcobamide:CoM methyltransferase MtaA [Methanobacteriaceae archaeon]